MNAAQVRALVDEAAAYNPPLAPLLSEPLTARLVSYGGAAFDMGIAPLLLCRRTRPVALLLAAAFHLTNLFAIDKETHDAAQALIVGGEIPVE